MIIKTRMVEWFNAAAMTAWPFIFINPKYAANEVIKDHEMVHYYMQKKAFIYGLGVGYLLLGLAYMLLLPVGWNPFRRWFESKAYMKSQGLTQAQVDEILRKPPYYLWWI